MSEAVRLAGLDPDVATAADMDAAYALFMNVFDAIRTTKVVQR